jgi:hypothetical protein
MQSRTHLLTDLLSYSRPLEQTVLSLRQFSWDADIALVTLNRHHIIQILQRYLRHDLVQSDVEAWANAVEGREDVSYEFGYEDVLQEIVHILANPILTSPLNDKLAERLLQKL